MSAHSLKMGLSISLARDAAHDVDAEFHPHAVNLVGQAFETLAVRGRRETVRRRQQAAVFVHRQFRTLAVFITVGIRLIPLDIDCEDVVSRGQQLLRHDVRILQRLCLGNGGGEGVPAVPAHRRARREQGCGAGADGRRARRQPDRGRALQHATAARQIQPRHSSPPGRRSTREAPLS